jgi:formate hydrogenlyase subunit 3/multisubunit Na+/H+ antiporter MnhD subunit
VICLIEINLFHYILTCLAIPLMVLVFSIGKKTSTEFVFMLNVLIPISTLILFYMGDHVVWYGSTHLVEQYKIFLPVVAMGSLLVVIFNGRSHPDLSAMANLLLVFSIVALSSQELISFVISLELLGVITLLITIYSSKTYGELDSILSTLFLKQIYFILPLLGIFLFYLSTGSLVFNNFHINNHSYLYFSAIMFLFSFISKLGVAPFHFGATLLFRYKEEKVNLASLLIEKVVFVTCYLGLMHQVIRDLHVDARENFELLVLAVTICATIYGGIITIKVESIKSSLAHLYMVNCAAILPLITITDNIRVYPVAFLYMISIGSAFSLFLIPFNLLPVEEKFTSFWSTAVSRCGSTAKVAIGVGLASILSFPFTLGFTAKLTLLTLISENKPLWIFAIGLSQIFSLIFIMRLLLSLFKHLESSTLHYSSLDKLGISDTISIWLLMMLAVFGGIYSLTLIEILL